MPTSPERWPLVGRTDVVHRAEALVGAGRSVLVAGEAGVGKTRLLRELADRFPDDRVTRIAATSSVGLPLRAFAPLAERVDGAGPPLVVVDDLQLLDEDAAALVHRLVAQSDIVLIGSLRTGEPTADAITAIWKDQHADRFDLGTLDRGEVDELLDRVLGGPIDAATRRRLWDTTLGWPLMLRELLRAALDDDVLVRRDGLWRLEGPPRSVRLDELIGARLDGLADDTRRVVELVALGEPVGLSALVGLVGHGPLVDAEDAGLVELVVDELRRDVRMVHPLYGQVAQHRMGELRAAQRYGELLELLETTPMRRRDDIVRATTWQLRSGGTTVTDDMVLAARRALYDERQRVAVELATRALADGRRHVEVALVLGQALVSLGEHDRAEQTLRGLESTRTDADRALVAMQRYIALFWGLGDADGAERVLLEARSTLAPGVWFDEVGAELAVLAANRGEVRWAAELAAPYLDAGGRVGVTAAIAAVSSWAIDGHCLDAVATAERAFAECLALGPQPALTDAGIFVVGQALAWAEAGKLTESDGLSRAAYELSVTQGRALGQAWFSLVLGRTSLARGRLGEAVDLFVEAAGGFAGLHSNGPRRWALAGAVIASALRGDPGAARRHHAELLDVPDHPARMMQVEVERAHAFAHVADGRLDAALDALRRAVDLASDTGAVSLGAIALHDIVRLGGAVDPGDWDLVVGCQGAFAPARRRYGRAMATGDAGELEGSAADFADIGADLHAAEAWQAAADVHEVAGRRREARRCRRCVVDAIAATGESSIVTLERQVSPVGITGREREVALLAAAGHTNRDIADRLYVSIRTVENHLQRVYAKLGITSRTELADVLVDAPVAR